MEFAENRWVRIISDVSVAQNSNGQARPEAKDRRGGQNLREHRADEQ